MNKKKLVMMAMALIMVAILAVGGTLAYFTSEDAATNVFVMGNVEIDLQEEFDQYSNLQPGLDVNKDVRVQNTGSNDAYVRVHLAIPTIMDDGDPAFDASQNFLHWNFTMDSVQDGKWSWIPEYTTGIGYKGNGAGNWNFYVQEIEGVEYNVYVATYRTALASGETTMDAITKVYLDTSVNAVANKDEEGNVLSYTYMDNKGNEFTLTVEEANSIKIKVWAEATQTATFDNAYDALDTAFGKPGTYNPWH